MHALSQRGEQVVQSMIGKNTFSEWDHYPDNDVRDNKNASQYFYHAHTGLQRPFDEHGHFHLFVHAEEMGLRKANPRFNPAPAHLVAVSMNAQGLPSGFFTVNRWVTKGPWLTFDQCEYGLKHFRVTGRQGKKEINSFLTSLVQMYFPHIMTLLKQRDHIMQTLSAERDRRTVFADHTIEVLNYLPIDLMRDITQLEQWVDGK